MRASPAPKLKRTAISPCRFTARASKSAATLIQATIRISAAAPKSSQQRQTNVSDQILFERNKMHAHIAWLFRNTLQDGGEVLFCHRRSHSRLQFAHHAQKFISAPFHVRPAWTNRMLWPNIRIWKKITTAGEAHR